MDFIEKDNMWVLTAIVCALCIVVNLSLPLWLFLARIYDERNATLGISNGSSDEDEEDDNDAVVSVVSVSEYSAVSSSLSISSQLTTNFLEARSRSRHPKKRKRERERDIRLAAEISKLNFEEVPVRAYPFSAAGSVSDVKSVMEKLSVDDVSMNDGVNESEDADKNSATNILYEKRSFCETLLEVCDWDTEARRLCSLAGFYTLRGFTETGIELVEVAIISHMIGTPEANAFIMSSFLFHLSATLTVGFQEAIGVLVPQADGSGNDILVGTYLQIGIIFYAVFQIPGFILWSSCMYNTVIWFGFDEETATITQNYTYSILLYTMVEGINECFLTFFDVADHEKYAMIFSVIRAFILAGSLIAMALSGVTDMVAIGLAQSLIETTLMFVNIIFVVNQGWLDDYWEGFVKTSGFKDARAMKMTFVTAVPLSFAWILSSGEWQIMLIFTQHIGPDEVATWNMLGLVWDLFEALTEAVSGAAEVRVGFRMGAGKPKQAKKMSQRSIYVGIIIAIFTAGVLFSIAEFLPSWLTPNPAYQKLMFDQIPLIGFGEILMVPMMVIEGIFCAQGRVQLMTYIEIVVSWLIAIPIAAILVYHFDFGLGGIVSALVIGYSTGATILFFFFLRSDWEGLSKIVVKQNAAEGLHYLDTDWDLLPSKVQEAASTLGYTRKLWETNKEPDSIDKNWKHLTKDEKTAAAVLGYNKNKWNGEADQGGGLFDEYDFEELPTKVRQAAEILGYTSSIWNMDGNTPIEEKDWSELTEVEQQAATILGLTEDKWDEDSDSDSSLHCPSMEMPAIPEERYDNYEFEDLPSEVKQAAKILGYTRSIWNKGGSIPNENKDWSELTGTEQNAATTLGYSEEEWDGDSDAESSSSKGSTPWNEPAQSQLQVNSKDCTPPSFKSSFTKYGEYNFDELPPEIQQASLVLGFTRSIWDKDTLLQGKIKHWDNLSSKEQEACEALGCTERKWDKWYAEIVPKSTGSNVSQVLCCVGIETSDYFGSNADR